jgi:hypothetical protein
MHVRVQPDPWSCLQIAAARSLAGTGDRVRLLKALYSLPEPVQEMPDFDALERTVLEWHWADPSARAQLQLFFDDFISRNRIGEPGSLRSDS